MSSNQIYAKYFWLKYKLQFITLQILYYQWRSKFTWNDEQIQIQFIIVSCVILTCAYISVMIHDATRMHMASRKSYTCICTLDDEQSVFSTSDKMLEIEEVCWLSVDDLPFIAKYNPPLHLWMQIYSTLSIIQSLMLCMKVKVSTMIQKMNEYDKKCSNELLFEYQVLTRELVQHQHEMYKKTLLIWS
eukprot:298892_1